jgi:hypothetical protein
MNRSRSILLFASLFALAAAGCASTPTSSAPMAAAAAPTPAAAAQSPNAMTDGRRWTRAFFEGRTQELWDHMSSDMKNVFHEKSGLDEFRGKARTQLGAETSVVSERIEHVDGAIAYVRVARFEHAPVPVRIVFAFDDGGEIVGFLIKPEERG